MQKKYFRDDCIEDEEEHEDDDMIRHSSYVSYSYSSSCSSSLFHKQRFVESL